MAVRRAPDDVRVLADSYEDAWEPDLTGRPTPDAELAGGSHPRSMVLEIAPHADRAVYRLALVNDQPWEPDAVADEFELLLSVNPSFTGLQLPESALALTA